MQAQVTIYSEGVVVHNKAFTVTQANRVIIRDTINGKLSSRFNKRYPVECGSEEVSAQFTDGDILGLHISSSLI